MKPLISIIIATYNYGRYLPEAIESALKQTYRPVEVVVIDDGSTDNTPEVVKPYLPQIRYYRQENAGVVVARNRGLQEARGDYIYFLDADDYISNDCIGRLYRSLKQHGVDFCYGDIKFVGARSDELVSFAWNKHLILLSNYIGLSGLIRHDSALRLGGFDRTFNRVADYEDWEFWIRGVERGLRGYHVGGDPVYFYRKSGVSRNVTSLTDKLHLRLRLARAHKSLYLSPLFLLKLPVLASILAKRKYFS